MVSVKFFASAAAVGLLSTAALAADLPPPRCINRHRKSRINPRRS